MDSAALGTTSTLSTQKRRSWRPVLELGMITQEETREKLGLTQQFKGGNLVKCRMRKLVRENTEARGDYPWMTSNVLQSETQTPICFGSLGAKQGFSLKQTSAAHLPSRILHPQLREQITQQTCQRLIKRRIKESLEFFCTINNRRLVAHIATGVISTCLGAIEGNWNRGVLTRNTFKKTSICNDSCSRATSLRHRWK